ncbi:MAG TPA: type II secretion system protein [Verrucomicrobiae bacterium]
MKLIQPTSKRLTAFTLIELIVVVGILAVLLVLFFPIPHPHRKRSQASVCLNNLKQVGVALSLYAADHSGLFPWQQFSVPGDTNSTPAIPAENLPVWSYYGRTFSDAYGPDWSGVNKNLLCPADTERKPSSFSKTRIKSDRETSYFIGLNEFNTREDVVALGDRNLSPGKGQPFYSSAHRKPVNVDTNTTVWVTNKNDQFHGDYGNLLFTDGHAESIRDMPALLISAMKSGGTNANRFLFPQ